MERTDPIDEAGLAALLEETGRRHHAAFAASDGVDPEWATWYAADLQARIWDRFGEVPSRSELTYLLVAAKRGHEAAGGDEAWPAFYARFMVAELLGPDT